MRLMTVGSCLLAVSVSCALSQDFSKISITHEWQNVWNGGEKKLVLRIVNNADKPFDGSITAIGENLLNEVVDAETILFKSPIAERGGVRSAIVWMRDSESILHLRYSASGRFIPLKQEQCSVRHKEAGRWNTEVGVDIFVYTPSSSRSDLMAIAAVYDAKHPAGRFAVHFFNNESATPTRFPMTDAQVKAHFASYEDGRLTRDGVGGKEY